MQHRSSRATERALLGNERPGGRIVAHALVAVAIVCMAAILPVAAAQTASRALIGNIGLGERIDNVLPPATAEGYSTHTYTVDVPDEATSITIDVDSGGADLDLAVDANGPIRDFAQVDHLDLGPGGDPSYTLMGLPAGRLHIEVLNLTARRAPYTITIRGEGVPIAVGDRFTGSFEGEGLEVVVTAEGNAYLGTLTLGTQRFPFEAVRNDGRLEGTFVSGGSEFGFGATLDGDVLTVESDGATFRTVRQPE